MKPQEGHLIFEEADLESDFVKSDLKWLCLKQKKNTEDNIITEEMNILNFICDLLR
jgi:hypothetical protein